VLIQKSEYVNKWRKMERGVKAKRAQNRSLGACSHQHSLLRNRTNNSRSENRSLLGEMPGQQVITDVSGTRRNVCIYQPKGRNTLLEVNVHEDGCAHLSSGSSVLEQLYAASANDRDTCRPWTKPRTVSYARWRDLSTWNTNQIRILRVTYFSADCQVFPVNRP
jgi:hypothetical protein